MPGVRLVSWLTLATLALSRGLTACSVYDASLLASSGSLPEGSGGARPVVEGGATSAGASSGDGGVSLGGAGNSSGEAPDSGGGSLGGADGAGDGGAAGQGGIAVSGASNSGQGDATGVLRASLVHRYSFSGTGTAVLDSVGSANGTVKNATLSGNGTLILTGGTSDQYVDLPNHIASSLTDATFEAWVSWGGGANWQRIFDFGSSDAGEGLQGNGVSYLFLSPAVATNYTRSTFSLTGNTAEVVVQTVEVKQATALTMAVVVDDSNDLLSLYVNGAFEASVAFPDHLSSLNDVNDWLGRSQFVDPAFSGTFDEFRIYDMALDSKALALSYSSGPNPSFLP